MKQEPDGEPTSPGGSCRVGVPHSFTGLTGVLLANGTTKPISEVKVGDYVLTAEPGKKKTEKHKVKAVIVTKTDRDYVDVVVDTKSGPKTIQTTKHHQFYEATKNAWTQAADLKAYQKLQNDTGGPTVVIDTKEYTAQRVTYDLSIEGLHTYYVLAGATPVLVHNQDDAAGEVFRDGSHRFQIFSNDHGPAHGHLMGPGIKGHGIQIGQNGKPLKENVQLSRAQQKVIDDNLGSIRKAIRKSMAAYKANRGSGC